MRRRIGAVKIANRWHQAANRLQRMANRWHSDGKLAAPRWQIDYVQTTNGVVPDHRKVVHWSLLESDWPCTLLVF